MKTKFTEVMAKRTDAELLKIVNEQRNDYQPDALLAAEEELRGRNLSIEQVATATEHNKVKQEIDNRKANEPLNPAFKVLTFLFPGGFQLIFSGTYKADGYDRKARELARYTLYGFGFYFGLALLILLLSAL